MNIGNSNQNINGSERGELIFGSQGDDKINALGGNDLIVSFFGDDEIFAGAGNDRVFSGVGDDVVNGGDGEDFLFGGNDNDIISGNKGDDTMLGGSGDDMLIWNNGDGSDLMDGGQGNDQVQVNFNTDLVNDDLQNKDVAEISVTDQGVQFSRVEVNDQSEFGLFDLDIRNTERLETNFGGGDDAAVLKGNVLDEITLDLDGGDGVDTLDLSQVDRAVEVNLADGTLGASSAVNFENVEGTQFDDVITGDDGDNVITGGSGNNIMAGGAGADTFVFREGDMGVNIILDFEVGVDRLRFETTNPDITTENLLASLTQEGDDVQLATNGRIITFEDTNIDDFSADSFFIA